MTVRTFMISLLGENFLKQETARKTDIECLVQVVGVRVCLSAPPPPRQWCACVRVCVCVIRKFLSLGIFLSLEKKFFGPIEKLLDYIDCQKTAGSTSVTGSWIQHRKGEQDGKGNIRYGGGEGEKGREAGRMMAGKIKPN